jgi:peptidyl-dipeptidase A
MSLLLDEQDPEEISTLFDELDTLTRESFAKEKDAIDEYLMRRFNITRDALAPRHYQNRFFQEAPKIYPVALDGYYAKQDIVELSRQYYASIGLPVEPILAKSDLYEKPNKYQHAYCLPVDKLNDVRIVCNIQPNQRRMDTQLHELGHAVYDYYMDHNVPFILRDAAHTFTTEAIAMMFGRFSTNPQWMKDMLHIGDDEINKIADACFSTLRLGQLVSSRWMQVMYRFEKSMYANPDQDLNTLRRDLVEQYQMMKRPV